MYKEYIKNLRRVCSQKGIKLHKIGVVGKNQKYSIFKITVGDPRKPAACFSAGIHGEEPAGSLAILDFLKKRDFKRFGSLRIIFLPVVNPYGFNKGIRRNFLNKDLNGHFCHKILTGENKILYDAVKDENIFFFHAIHEDKGLKSFYLYNFENKKEGVYRDIIKLARKYFPINSARKIYGDPAKSGIISNRKDGSFEDRLFRDRVPYSMCTETPEAQQLQRRVDLDVAIINLVLRFCKKCDRDGSFNFQSRHLKNL